MSASKVFEKGPPEPDVATDPSIGTGDDVTHGTTVKITAGSQALHRKLRGKEVQLFAIGGAIGTCKSADLKKSWTTANNAKLYMCRWALPFPKVVPPASSSASSSGEL